MREIFEDAQDRVEMGLIGANIWFRREVVKPVRDYLRNEDGDIVQTVIIAAVFAIITVAVINIVGGAIRDKGNEAADTIKGADFS